MAFSKLPLKIMAAFVAVLFLSSTAFAASDFNVLTLTWSAAVCRDIRTPCCVPTTGMPSLDFLVESLETYNSATGQLVTNCTSPCAFYVNALRDIVGQLFKYWPDLSCPSNNGKDKWQSNWCTYGTCTSLRQRDYFNNTLVLRERVDPLFILSEFDIVPSKDKMYKLQDIEDALRPSLGFSFYIECKRQLREIRWELFKIHFCVSADAKILITCENIPTKSNCGANVLFYPFTKDLLRDNAIETSSEEQRVTI